MPLCSYLFKRTSDSVCNAIFCSFRTSPQVLSFRDQFPGIIATRASIGMVIVGYTPSEIILGLPA